MKAIIKDAEILISKIKPITFYITEDGKEFRLKTRLNFMKR